MSNYQFFASEKPLKEFDNMHVLHRFTPEEESGIVFRQATSEETAMRIIKEDDFFYASQYTDKKYVNFIEWRYNDTNAKTILDYIKEHLKDRFTIQLFNTWMGDNSPLQCSKTHIDALTVEDIKNIWGQNFFYHNECLTVYKNY